MPWPLLSGKWSFLEPGGLQLSGPTQALPAAQSSAGQREAAGQGHEGALSWGLEMKLKLAKLSSWCPTAATPFQDLAVLGQAAQGGSGSSRVLSTPSHSMGGIL